MSRVFILKDYMEHHDEQLEYIATAIRSYRYNNGYTQEDLCELADIHPNTLSNIENCHGYNIGTLLSIIDATGLSLSEFFWGVC